jgi:DNA topoisomerase-6 subunit A
LKKKQTKQDKLNKTKDLIDLLKKHGAQVYEDLENGEFPKFSIPNRSISNIIYDKKLRQYVL